MYTGRIAKEKGVKELIEAISRCTDTNIALLVIGSSSFGLKKSSPFEKEIQRMCEKTNRKIIFTGYVHNSNLYKYHEISSVAVVPSVWDEPAGLVVLEAMASGKPLIVTRSGGIPEYTNNKAAIIIENNENIVENLASSITYLKNNPSTMREMGQYGEEHAKNFSPSRYFNDFTKIINDISKEQTQ